MPARGRFFQNLLTPLVHMISLEKSKIIRTGYLFTHKKYRGDPALVREFGFPALGFSLPLFTPKVETWPPKEVLGDKEKRPEVLAHKGSLRIFFLLYTLGPKMITRTILSFWN